MRCLDFFLTRLLGGWQNMFPALIANSTIPLVNQIRAVFPTLPIILAQGTPDGQSWILAANRNTQLARESALLQVHTWFLAFFLGSNFDFRTLIFLHRVTPICILYQVAAFLIFRVIQITW